jgi:DNA-binding transcriptional MerR regulator
VQALDAPLPAAITIDELARRTGVTTRNIRAYQAGGLLPPPTRHGRVGFYGDEHRARLEVIRDLRARGLGLEAIAAVLERAPGSARSDLSAFARAMTSALFLDAERPTIMTADAFLETWGEQLTPATIERVLRIGLYRQIDADHYEVLSPTLEQYGRELAKLDVPLTVVLDLSEKLYEHSRAIARTYVDALIEHVIRPLLAKNGGTLKFSDFEEIATHLRPLASGSVSAAFPVAYQRELDLALASLTKES